MQQLSILVSAGLLALSLSACGGDLRADGQDPRTAFDGSSPKPTTGPEDGGTSADAGNDGSQPADGGPLPLPGPGIEARCVELGESCACSEPLDTATWTLAGSNHANPDDSGSHGCEGEVGRGSVWYKADEDLEPTTDLSGLPTGHSLNYVWRNPSQSGTSTIFGNKVAQGSRTKRLCTRFYVNYSQDYIGVVDSPVDPQTGKHYCISNKVAEFGMGASIQLKEQGVFSTGIHGPYSGGGKNIGCASDSDRMNHNDCKDQWCIIEHCVSGNLGSGSDIHYEGYIRGLNDGKQCDLPRTNLGDAPNGGGVGKVWIANMYRKNDKAAPADTKWCKGSRRFSHAMQAEWDTDNGQFIGCAEEVEGTCR